MIYKKFNKLELIAAITTALIIFFFYFFFNYNYLTNFIDERYDANTYRNYVYSYIYHEDKGQLNFYHKFNIYNPHHLAFEWLGLTTYKKLYKNDYSEKTLMTFLQLINLVVSSLGLSIIFILFYKISKKYLLSFLLTGMIAFSCGYWIYSQINDTPLIHSVLVALLFFAVIYFPQTKNKYFYSVFLGIFHAVTIFFHQSDFLFFFVIMFVILLADNFKIFEQNKNFKNIDFISNKEIKLQNRTAFKIFNIRYFLIYLFVFILIVGSVYYYIGLVYLDLTLDPEKAITVNRIENSTYFFKWIRLYSNIGYWGRGYENNTLGNIVKGVSTYFYESNLYLKGEKIDGNLSSLFNPSNLLPNLIGIFIFCIIILNIICSFFLFKKYKYVFIANIIFMVFYMIFAGWWEPYYREFWVAPMFSFWILAFLIINFILDKIKIIKPIAAFALYSYMFILVFLLFFVNFTGFMYPNASADFRKFDIINDNKIIYKIEEE